MRFHEPVVGVIRRNNCQVDGSSSQFVINTTAASNQVTSENIFYSDNGNENFSSEKCLQTLKSIIHEKDTETVGNANAKTNNFDSRDVNCVTSLEAFLKLKADSCGYFKNFLDTDSNGDLNGNGDTDNVILIETLNLTEDNLSRFVTTTRTTAYDNCVTNHSYNQQNCLSNVQRKRRENLIKLDFGSMTKHEGPLHSNGGDSAGCSIESSPVDSLLDDQELVSPTPSSLADLSSPDTHDLQVLTRYPRGIINPNYPGFQDFAHTLAEHFIDHFEQQLSDSEISDDIDFDVLAYRSGNLVNANIMNDSNNNNDNINNNADEMEERSAMAIDLNRNKNRQNASLLLAHDYSTKADDGNVNLLMKSEPKVFCESKQLDIDERVIEFSSEDEDEECCNLSQVVEPQQMDFDDDEMADLSGEDDAAIKNELERIDNDFNENINCDLVTYLQQYEFKNDSETDEDNSKLPTPDILVEHNNKLQNDDDKDVIIVEEGSICVDETKNPLTKDEARDFQPDLIKSISDNNHERITGDNEILSHAEKEEEKIINQVQTEMSIVAATSSVQLSFDSTTSTVVDIIGDFGKEIEKEIGLIVSGYLDVDKSAPLSTPTSPQTNEPIRPLKVEQPMSFNNKEEIVFDENKFIEHVKYFSKMGDAALSNAEEIISVKNSLVGVDERRETALIPTAIVKPKYQKLSFDERQLPIRGSTETELWTELTTITTTPRKVQKHLPKNQKSNRKLMTANGKSGVEICSDFNVTDKVAINANCRFDIECSDTPQQQQNYNNSVAIVQPIKKVIDTNKSDEEKMSGIEKEEIDYSINSDAMKAEPRNRKSSDGEISLTNESKVVARMSDYGYNNSNVFNRKCAERENVSEERKVPTEREVKKKILPMSQSDAFDVYNIETALPVIDMEAIESHLMAAAKEEEMKRKNDRESIRRRLAMGEEDDYLTVARPVRKPNLQSRLQSGQNLQICFMNEAASDSESSDSETCPKLSQGMSRRKNVQQRSSSLISHRSTALNNNPYSSRPLTVAKSSVMDRTERAERPATLALNVNDMSDNNFFTQQARLQIEARMALAQAKDIAHMQIEFERQRQPMCPITELVHQTLEKVGMKVPPTKRRLSRQLLTNMNIAQLQIIINEFHSFIETLNETLVRYLMDRDDLSMRQDSLLIDIEDITRYLGEKEEVKLSNTPQSATQHLDPKKAAAQRTTVIRYQQYPPSFLQNYKNPHKKSLMVNGNGHSSVITREKFDHRNRLHL